MYTKYQHSTEAGLVYVQILIDLLDGKDFESATRLITDTPYEARFKREVWYLLPVLFKNVRKEVPIDLRTCSENLLEILAARIEPEEMVMEFADQMEDADIVRFTCLLKLLTISLPLCTQYRSQYIQLSLACIRTYLDEFIPSDTDFMSEEEYEDELLNQLEDIVKILNSVLDYYEFFMLSESSVSGKLAEVLSVQLIELYHFFLPVSDDPKLQSLKSVELRLISLITKSVPDPFYLLQFIFPRSIKLYNVPEPKKNHQFKDLRDFCDEVNPSDVNENCSVYEMESAVSNLSYATYFYSVVCLNAQKTPFVYSPKYIFLTLVFLAQSFFAKNYDKTINKGLQLMQTVLNLVGDNKLERYELYFSFNEKILTQLNSIAIYSQVEATRKLALVCFQKYIEKFDYEGKYLLLINLRKKVDHSGTIGFIVTLLKDYISHSMDNRICNSHLKYYSGRLLYNIIAEYCFLKGGERTDLVQNADHVISSLNMLRFIVLKDKENKTGIRNFIDKIKNHFLKPLENGIKSEKEFYELSLQEQGKDGAPSQTNNDNKIEMTLNGQPFAELTKEQKESALHASLNAVDLIDTILLRVNECINDCMQ